MLEGSKDFFFYKRLTNEQPILLNDSLFLDVRTFSNIHAGNTGRPFPRVSQKRLV